MINIETVKFIQMIDSLCELSISGFLPLTDLDETEEIKPCVYYDPYHCIENDYTGERMFKAVFVPLEAAETDDPEDSAVLWESYIETNTDYSVYVVFSDEEEPKLYVYIDSELIIIEDGMYYFA